MTSIHNDDPLPLRLERRNPLARLGPVPDVRIDDLLHARDAGTLVRRAPSTTGSSSASVKTCGPNDKSGYCERPTSSTDNTTLPVVLGVVIPITVAFVIFIILHRRHVKKLRQEDADDRNKPLDYGMGEGVQEKRKGRKRGNNVPEMSLTEAEETIRRGRGLSMDMDLANPFVLPAGLQQSRESLHSLSRSMNNDDDKYRPATSYNPNETSASYPSSVKSPVDDSSSLTGSSRRRFDTDSNRVLMKNAHRRSGPPTRPGSAKSAAGAIHDPERGFRRPLGPVTNNANSLMPMPFEAMRDSYMSTTSTGPDAAIRASNNYLGAYIRGGLPEHPGGISSQQRSGPATENPSDSSTSPVEPQIPPPAYLKSATTTRRSSVVDPSILRAQDVGPTLPSVGTVNDSQTGGSVEQSEPALERGPRLPHMSLLGTADFQQDFRLPEADDSSAEMLQPDLQQAHLVHDLVTQQPPHEHDAGDADCDSPDVVSSPHDDVDYYDIAEYQEALGYDPRRLTMGTRPLPPDDPSENPEQRANRIRSFYKEYFDESKPPTTQQPQEQQQPQRHEQYQQHQQHQQHQQYQQYQQHQQHQQHQQPQQPRRTQQQVAYFDGSEDFADEYYEEPYVEQLPYPSHGGPRYAGLERHRATFSAGSSVSGPRPYSSASGQGSVSSRRGPQKKKLPPPKPLNVLPTPHMLKDDNFMPIDFAPPSTFNDRRTGTPESLRGGVRTYSPGPRGHNPLVSSFDDLSVMPSPHALRKSATFSGLDFAPPPKLRHGVDTGSDTGSIRSNGSAMSQAQLHSIRAGAYRVSRIPKEVAGTKDELSDALRPQWDMRKV